MLFSYLFAAVEQQIVEELEHFFRASFCTLLLARFVQTQVHQKCRRVLQAVARVEGRLHPGRGGKLLQVGQEPLDDSSLDHLLSYGTPKQISKFINKYLFTNNTLS